MSAPSNDIHDSVFAEIEGRISTLRSGAPASALGRGAWTQAEVDAELAQLESDQALLLAHWRTQDGVVAETALARAQKRPYALGMHARSAAFIGTDTAGSRCSSVLAEGRWRMTKLVVAWRW